MDGWLSKKKRSADPGFLSQTEVRSEQIYVTELIYLLQTWNNTLRDANNSCVNEIKSLNPTEIVWSIPLHSPGNQSKGRSTAAAEFDGSFRSSNPFINVSSRHSSVPSQTLILRVLSVTVISLSTNQSVESIWLCRRETCKHHQTTVTAQINMHCWQALGRHNKSSLFRVDYTGKLMLCCAIQVSSVYFPFALKSHNKMELENREAAHLMLTKGVCTHHFGHIDSWHVSACVLLISCTVVGTCVISTAFVGYTVDYVHTCNGKRVSHV